MLAQNISSLGYEQILAQYVFVTPNVIETIFLQIPGAWEAFNGQGIDLGGGVACISSTSATKPNVQPMYSIEIPEDFVILCHPIVIK